MTELMKIRDGITRLFTSGLECREATAEKYRSFSYPRHIRLMHFDVQKQRIDGFGSLMTMLTDTVFGMQLLTCSFMPFEGAGVPYLLIDVMVMKNKRTVFVEYYDCTQANAAQPLLEKVCEKYCLVNDYDEKDAWYVSERTGYSLIKSLDPRGNRHELSRLIADSVRAYKRSALGAEKCSENLRGLLRFRERMMNEGNPSSAVLEKVFGKEGAREFFKSCVMPES